MNRVAVLAPAYGRAAVLAPAYGPVIFSKGSKIWNLFAAREGVAEKGGEDAQRPNYGEWNESPSSTALPPPVCVSAISCAVETVHSLNDAGALLRNNLDFCLSVDTFQCFTFRLGGYIAAPECLSFPIHSSNCAVLQLFLKFCNSSAVWCLYCNNAEDHYN